MNTKQKEISMNLKPIIITIFVLLMCGTASAAWANASYTYAKDITLLGADTQLSNYPYLVSVAKEPGMQADYDDLIFYDQPVSQDGNLIDFEIETYNATTATVWLNITTLPTAGKTISMYYGNSGAISTQNPTAVWDPDYVGVWHMSDDVAAGDYAWNNYKDPNGVITANASQYYVLAEPSVFYEDGKFKMWMREHNGTSPHAGYLGYWESADGYDWTEIGTRLLGGASDVSHCRHPFVMKDPDSTGYWLYNMNESAAKEDLYYGTTETDWSINTYGIFSASDVGGASMIGNVFVWRENTSDWYMLCENNAPTWTSDYATSNDGKSWTFHGQVIASGFGSNGLSGPHIHKNNGTYYMLFHGNKGNDGGIPSDIYVATSTDRQTWVYQPGFEITRTEDWEGVGQSGGQCGDPTFAEKNNELYIYYQGGHDQNATDGIWPLRIGLCHLNESLQEVCDHIDTGETTTTPTATDSTSNNNDGQIDIGSGDSAAGIIGDAIDFSSTHIAVNTNDFYDIGTVSWWQNSTSIDAGMVFSGNENVADSNNYSQIGKDGSGSMYAQFKAESVVDTLRSDADMVQGNETQYVVWTSDGSTAKCFVNGTEVSLTATDGANTGRWFSDIPNINKYGIGSLRKVAQDYLPFTGTIDEVELSKSVRSNDWINLSRQMVVDGSYVTFGAEETASSDVNSIVLGANKYGMLRKSVTSAETFSTIASEFSHDVCFTWWDSTNDRWESYYSGDSYNSAKSVPEHDSYFVLMDGTGETVSCSVATAENVDIPIGWSSTYLREQDAKTLSAIKTDMGSNCADVYAWDHTASETGAWTNTGTFSVSPNQGILVDASSGFTWDGSVS